MQGEIITSRIDFVERGHQCLEGPLTAVGDGTASFEMPVSSQHYNPNGVVHGGAITSIADSAMGFAVYSTLAPGENFTTAEIHVNFIKPARTH